MKREGTKFTEEVKVKAVNLIFEQGYSISEAVMNLGIHTNLLGRCKIGISTIYY